MAQNTNPLIKHRLLSVVLAMVFYLLSGTDLSAQTQAPNYQLTYLEGQEKGAIESFIINVFQDTLGFVWAINYSGKLLQYNGLFFEEIKIQSQANDNILSGINPWPKSTIDKNGCIWVSYSNKGVFQFNPYNLSIKYYDQTAFIKSKDETPQITGVESDQNGQIWISTTNNLLRYNYLKDKFILIYENLNAERISIQCDGGKNYIIIQEKLNGHFQYIKVNKKTGIPTLYDSKVSTNSYRKLGATWMGRGDYVWEANPKTGIYKRFITNNKLKFLYKPSAKQTINIQNVHLIWESPNGEVWICEYGKGIYVIPQRNTNSTYLDLNAFLLHDKINSIILSIMQDKNNNFWLATKQGLWKGVCDPSPFNKVEYESFIPTSKFKDQDLDIPLVILDNRTLLLGKENGLYLFDIYSKSLLRAENRFPVLSKISTSAIDFLYSDSNSNIWICAINELNKTRKWFKFITKQNQLKPLDNFAGFNTQFNNSLQSVYSAFEDEKGSFYFLDWLSPDLIKVASETDSLSFFRFNGIHLEAYECFYDSSKKQLWVATNRQGLFLYDWTKHAYTRYYFDPIKSPNTPNMNNGVMKKTKNGRLIYKTFNTLFEYDYESQRFIKKVSGLKDFSSFLCDDKNGDIWLNSEKGILKIDSTLNKYIYFNEKSGLIHNSLPNGSLLRDSADWIYASDLDGIIYFHPDSVKTNTQIPPVYISNLKLFNHDVLPGDSTGILTQSIAITPSITLQYQQNVLTLEYIALNYQDSDQNEYAYMLEGFDEQWQYVGSKREVSYTNLSPGTYTFRVKGSNNHGVWNEQGASLEITVLPPWYRTSLAYLCYVMFVAGGIFFLYKFQLNRQLEKQESIRLRELNEFKSQLYTGITHEFRTPLTVILGMAEQAVGFFEKRDAQRFQNAIKLVERNSHQLLHLVNQMLDLASLDAGKIQPDWEQGNAVGFIRYIVESFNSYADSRGVSLSQNHAQTELIMDFDSDKLQKILSNLLTNAIKFTPKGGSVELKSSCSSSHFVLQVNDTGTGIAQDDLPLIFDRFFRSENNENYSEGTGIGLALTKELTVLLGGAIHVESTPGKGTNFSVSLPIHNTAPIVSKVQDARTHFPVQTASVSKGKEGGPMLLIVEDNEEVAAYLASCLEDQYQLLYARNGQEGIDLALEHIPDFIISDVMMPKKSGFEVCHTLKSDERTSHIPIVLLTAKADESSRHDGLQQGADAYLTKPFNSKELQIRIEQMIALRKRLQIKYQHRAQNLTDLPEDVANENNPQEEAFLQKLRLEVEQLLNHPNLDVSLLCRSMGMSRTQLHRKLSAVAAMSTTQFIRNVRYQKAKQLLRKTDLSIAEIAYDVGFSDPAYFTRMFKKELGLTPTEFREK